MLVEPYYAQHKVTGLTCPHCKGMLSFLINERDKGTKYLCRCGYWWSSRDWWPPGAKETWIYQVHDTVTANGNINNHNSDISNLANS